MLPTDVCEFQTPKIKPEKIEDALKTYLNHKETKVSDNSENNATILFIATN